MRTSWLKFSTPGNSIDISWNYEHIFSQWLAAVRMAREQIYLFTYIFELDSVGTGMKLALIEAARRGVRVFLVVDGYGSRELPPEFFEEMDRAGVRCIRFRPLSHFYRLGSWVFRRLHQKILCVDGERAWIGGMNVTSKQFTMLDTCAFVQGPVVARIQRYCEIFVFRHQHRWRNFLRARLKRIKRRSNPTGPRTAFLIRNNFRFRTQIEQAYVEAINAARHRIWIANAYFTPRRSIQRALFNAAKRGVDVRIVVQGISDLPFIKDATEIFYRRFLRQGIKLYEYHSQILHTKSALVDENWSTTGSANLDLLSLALSLESNILTVDPATNQTLAKDFEKFFFKNPECRPILKMPKQNLASRYRKMMSLLIFRLLKFLALKEPYEI